MGNNLSPNHRRNSSVQDEKIMFDIQNRLYAVANQTSNTTSRSKSPSDIASHHRRQYSSQQLSYDFDQHTKPNAPIPLQKHSPTVTNKLITEKLETEETTQKYTLNMLLSGNETSGKYIIFKQLEQAFKGGIDTQQTQIALDAIRILIVTNMVAICNLNLQTQQNESIHKIRNSELHQICVRISQLKHMSYNLTNELAMTLYLLWNDKSIQLTYKKAIDSHILNESTKYFMDKILEIGQKNYKLTFDDYIEIRAAQSNGISSKQFLIETKYGKYKFNVNHINKQKGERKKWVTYLDNINIFVYVINIAEYDTYDNDIGQIMDVFNNICKEKQFMNTDFVVLLNGINKFENKIKTIPFNCNGLDVTKPNDSKCVMDCIVNNFKNIFKVNSIYNEKHNGNGKQRSIYFHKINASNMQQIGLLLQKIHTDVITTSMKRMGYVL